MPPTKIVLEVPFTHQPDRFTCGPTSLHMCMAFYGTEVAIDDVEEYQKAGVPWHSGSSHGPLLDAAKHYGFSETSHFVGYEELVKRVSDGNPCLVNIKSVINPNGGHYAVVTGFSTDEAGNLFEVFLNDPSGGHKKYKRRFFESLWKKRSHWGMSLKQGPTIR